MASYDCLRLDDMFADSRCGDTYYCVDPLEDCRWEAFLQQHPHASLFHSTAWLRALANTYGYTPVIYTTSPLQRPLQNGIVFCQVDSWLTGRRLVSLPFSDYCEPLVDTPNAMERITAALDDSFPQNNWRYIEFRPLEPFQFNSELDRIIIKYTLHQVDLRVDIDTIFSNFHKSSIQRKIRRAFRENLVYREGSNQTFLDAFYQLLTFTRKVHKRPPQPKAWFTNLLNNFGEAATIRVAFKDDRAVAAMLTIRYKNTLFYKYGASDPGFHNLGAVHFLYWRAIVDAKAGGLEVFDLGRTDLDQPGLITFKSRWGAKQSVLTYFRFGAAGSSTHWFDVPALNWKPRAAQYVFAHLPDYALSKLGGILYRHVG